MNWYSHTEKAHQSPRATFYMLYLEERGRNAPRRRNTLESAHELEHEVLASCLSNDT